MKIIIKIRCNTHMLCFSGTSIRRDGEEWWRSRITSYLKPVLPVPLFLYNSGEYFYLLFSKGSFFSSLIVETHFLWKLQCILRGISSHPTFVHPEQLLSVSSSFQSGKELRHGHTHILRLAFTKTVGQLAQMTNIPLAQWGIFFCLFECV